VRRAPPVFGEGFGMLGVLARHGRTASLGKRVEEASELL
jgi:hypothetical protein